jgi:hypothetical protein
MIGCPDTVAGTAAGPAVVLSRSRPSAWHQQQQRNADNDGNCDIIVGSSSLRQNRTWRHGDKTEPGAGNDPRTISTFTNISMSRSSGHDHLRLCTMDCRRLANEVVICKWRVKPNSVNLEREHC